MKLYYIEGAGDDTYAATLGEAKRRAREVAEDSHFDVNVYRVEVATDQAAIIQMLNTNGCGAHVDLGVVYTAKARKKAEV